MLIPADVSLRIRPTYRLCRAWSPPPQLVRSPLDEGSCVMPPPIGLCRPQLPLNVRPNDWPVNELGGERSMLPNTDPLSVSRSEPKRRFTDGTPRSSRMSRNRATESYAMPALWSPRGPVP